jgi:hypothetical protein
MERLLGHRIDGTRCSTGPQCDLLVCSDLGIARINRQGDVVDKRETLR